tara:strand:+ start:203 stop:427 length:225 start_codon:yes stop_codon:yes gene_type:complete
MVETEFHFQVEPLLELMQVVVVVGILELPVVQEEEEHLYQLPTIRVLVQIEQRELMAARIPVGVVVLQNGVDLA